MKWSCVAVLVVLVAVPAPAAEQAPAVDPPAGVVKVLRGSVSIERGAQRQPAAVGSPVAVGDTVVTGGDGSVGITLRDNTILSAGPDSSLALKGFSFDPATHAGSLDAAVSRGTLGVISGKIAKASPQAVRFSTPVAVLGVSGTEFLVEAGRGE